MAVSAVQFFFHALLFATAARGQVYFAKISAAIYTELSETCVAVLNQIVQCSPAIELAGRGRFEDDSTLAEICTTTCNSAIATWQRRVNGACGTTRYNDGHGHLVLPQVFPEIVREQYDLLCLQHELVFPSC